jgi:phage-related protein
VLTKPLLWLGSSLQDVRRFPPDARRLTGYQLRLVQQGLEPSDWKPMPAVGHGIYELRISTGMAYRVFYIAKFAEAVYVLHAFEKRTRKTSQGDIELAKTRLSQLLPQRQGRKG